MKGSPAIVDADPLLAAFFLPTGRALLPRADVTATAILSAVAPHAVPAPFVFLIALVGLFFTLLRLLFVSATAGCSRRLLFFGAPASLQRGVILGAAHAEVLANEFRLLLADVDAVAVVPFFARVARYHETGAVRAAADAVGLSILLQQRVNLGLTLGEQELFGYLLALFKI